MDHFEDEQSFSLIERFTLGLGLCYRMKTSSTSYLPLPLRLHPDAAFMYTLNRKRASDILETELRFVSTPCIVG